MEFKDRIKLAREEKQISAAQLADFFGITEDAVALWETGQTKPDADMLIRLADYFECTADYLLGRRYYKNDFINASDYARSVLQRVDRFEQEIQYSYYRIMDSLSECCAALESCRGISVISALDYIGRINYLIAKQCSDAMVICGIDCSNYDESGFSKLRGEISATVEHNREAVQKTLSGFYSGLEDYMIGEIDSKKNARE